MEKNGEDAEMLMLPVAVEADEALPSDDRKAGAERIQFGDLDVGGIDLVGAFSAQGDASSCPSSIA